MKVKYSIDFYTQSPDYLNKCEEYLNDLYPNLEGEYKKLALNLLYVRSRSNINLFNSVLSNSKIKFDLKSRIISVIKFFLHKINYLFFKISKNRKMNEKKILIKCFNELHYNIHLNEIRDVVTSNILVLLLPYLQSMRRQLRFLKTLKKGNIEYICFGYNYCFISLLKFVFKGSLESQVLFEFSPFEKRSNDFSPFKGKAFVSDDFEINSFLFNRNLIFNGINVVNRCHGIGKYSPHVSYNISYFYNKTQEAFYLKYNVLNSKIFKYKEKKINKYLPITYLFISQSKSNMDPLFELENEILNKMKSILAENAPNLYVKLHPDFNGKFNFPILDNLNDFNGLIFTFYSTCYYTFKRYGPTFLIKINNIKSNLIFGDDSRYIKITELNNYEEFLEFA